VPLWNNRSLRLFHGTDSLSVGSLPAVGAVFPGFVVNLARCRPYSDFGQGFYTTTRLHQARQRANTRVLRAPSAPGLYAIVLRFDLDRDWLAGLDVLAFARAIRDFWDLVTDCYNGFPPHQRQPPSPAPYDVVYGPVTIWPQTLLINDCDQISFHTQRSAAGLGSPYLHDSADNQPGGLFPP
jgi:Protein of unknown function (DUF3990)